MILTGRWLRWTVPSKSLLAGRPTYFSWRGLLTGAPPDPRELRRFIQVKPVLDYAALKPGEAPTNFIRSSWSELGFSRLRGYGCG